MNELQFETSPYLLQHQNNPVHWHAWNSKALEKAKNENKLILISVGYAACHWCHVMEHQSFEDNEVAEVMNKFFISIKVDREERPDIDQIYMNAAQLTSGHGGWPLNVVCLPNGKPIYGATYFPKEKWIQFLLHFQNLFQTQTEKITAQAERISNGLQTIDTITLNTNNRMFESKHLDIIWQNWESKLDFEHGASLGEPKFMMPNNLEFLLRYAYQTNNENCKAYIKTTLKKMAFGGIHDIVGGGFARYSVDYLWKIPHFEKMLYDNAQLLSVYAMAFQQTKRPMYKSVCQNILAWIDREMTSEAGGIYASLDADSEGVEGKFYCWSFLDYIEAIQACEIALDKKIWTEFALELYNITEAGNFEHGLNILYRIQEHEYFCEKYNIDNTTFQTWVNAINQVLLLKREQKIRPTLDDKILTEWNALCIKGLVDAYKAFQNEKFLEKAIRITNFVLTNVKQDDYRLYRNFKNGQPSINAFLQDYVFLIEALIGLYQVTLSEEYLIHAQHFTSYCIEHFYSKTHQMFYITSDIDEQLIVRSMDSSDNVIPAANSQMAKCLLLLSKYFNIEEYEKIATAMLNNVLDLVLNNGSFYSNWAIVLDMFIHQHKELVVVGKNALVELQKINSNYLPNILIAGSLCSNNLPLLQNRYVEGKTLFYLCENKSCQYPQENFENLKLE
jgi:uncharacterized protein YyaL (SSP411 family)